MTNFGWRLVELLAVQLSPAEREVALGDLIETRETAWQGMREISGLVFRRQCQLWKSWRPWLAAPGLAFPCSLMLMGFSFAISMEVHNYFVLGGRLSSSPTGPVEALPLLYRLPVLLICSWAAGFVVESVSRSTFVVTQVCCILPCMFCLMRFHHESLPRLCLLLFLFPAIAGVRFSHRGGSMSRSWAIALALIATTCMAALAVRGHLWFLNWELIVPPWYLAILSGRSVRLATLQNEGTLP
jgi:hypothetical protein